MPKFSVVISVFNKEMYIADTLKSVLAQTFTNFEVVILNDGSTDNSEAEILKFNDPRIRYFTKENQGAGAARNFVIKEAKSDYIALLDADDIWLPYYLEEQSRLIEKYPYQAVFATASSIKRGSKVFQRTYSINLRNQKDIIINYFEGSLLDSALHSSTTVLKKEVFENIGYYDPTIKSGQDTNLYIRIGLHYKVVFSPQICVYYNLTENSLFRSSNKMNDKLDLEIFSAFEEQNKSLKKYLDLNRYSLCIFAKKIGDTNFFEKTIHKIDRSNLSRKQLFILQQSRKTLLLLFKLQSFLSKNGISIGTFN